jgi:NADH:ubiquinone oxidoreductase subunit 2 (subunit N)
MLTEESHPWTVSFLLVMMQVGFALFFLKFLNQYGWLRTLPELDTFLKWIGVFCILWAGIIAAFQTDLNRLLGYFFLAETGYIAFSMAYRGTNGLEVMAMTFVTRFLAHWALAITLSSLQRLTGHQSLSFDTLRGVIHRYPFVSILLICSLLNVIGMPLFSLYPTKHIIWNLVSSDNLALALLVAVGIFGMLTMFLRLFSAIIHPEIKSAPTTSEEPGTETIGLKIMVILILLVIVLPGIFPDILSRPLRELLVSFENLTH